MPREDSEIIEGCLKGEEAAFRALLQKYRARVFSIALRIVSNDEDARDIAQETFVRVFKSLSQFDQERSFQNWLFRIAVNLSIDLMRKRKFAFFSLSGNKEDGTKDHDIEDQSPTPDVSYESKAGAERFESLIESLPVKYKTLLVLRYKEELSYQEMAEVMGIPMGTIKARLHRGHRILRRKLETKKARAGTGLRARVVF
ncbi:MAG: sigma-70 family RNA polymerase sigma factor [Candidatus Eisenbacteria bacterium]|nr:sigma-70 family RNA polymerase sigma factor [Candidatus Eisenbacteria bacterium]